MAQDASEDNQHFEQVLHRLDALMKRNQTGTQADGLMSGPPAFVILPPPGESWGEVPEEAAPATDDEDDGIPLLTEIYQEAMPATVPAGSAATCTQDALQALLPQLQEALERAVAEETARLREMLTARLERQLHDLLAGQPPNQPPADPP